VKGKTTPVDLLATDGASVEPETPCTVCTVGPMLEFNLLFQRPARCRGRERAAYA